MLQGGREDRKETGKSGREGREAEGCLPISPTAMQSSQQPHKGIAVAVPIYQMRNWGRVPSLPSSRIWEHRGWGLWSKGQRKGPPVSGEQPWLVAQAEQRREPSSRKDTGVGSNAGPGRLPAGDCRPLLVRIPEAPRPPTPLPAHGMWGSLPCSRC